MKKIILDIGETKAEVYLHGAHLTSLILKGE